MVSDGWLTRTDLHRDLGGHTPAAALDRALALLTEAALIEERATVAGAAGGRPGVAYRLAAHMPREETELSEETPVDLWEDGGDAGVNSVSSDNSQGHMSQDSADRVYGTVTL